VEIKAVPSFDAVSLRMISPSYDDERLGWEKLGSYIKSKGIAVSSPYCEFCEFHNEGNVAADGVDIEIVVAVDEKRPDEAPFRFFRTEAFDRVAAIMVYGPYENIAPIYASFASWLENHPTLRMVGDTREIAHVGCWNEENPADYITEFQIPVAERR
ncbi:MAG: GyrI-like domain-containing protein, partial [Raoultibacter sp.]